MDPIHNHPLSASNEGSSKNDKDFKNTNKQTLNNSSGTKMRIPVFDLPQIKKKPQQPRKNRQQKSSDFNHSTAYPKRGTFDIPDYQSLLAKSNNLFQKRHHILAKLSSNGVYDEIYEEDEDLINLMEDTLNQPDVLYKETSKAVVQSCQDSYTIQNLIKEKIFETSQYTEFKSKVDGYYKKAELFMHAVSSDDEPPTNLKPEERFYPKEIRKRLRKQTGRKDKISIGETQKLKKRVKKIIKKLRFEAFECEDYNRSSKNLVELQQLILRNKVADKVPLVGETNLEFNKKTIEELKLELDSLEQKTQEYKSLGYYEDQIYFHQTEKRFKNKTKEIELDDTSNILNSSYKVVKKNVANIQNMLMNY